MNIAINISVFQYNDSFKEMVKKIINQDNKVYVIADEEDYNFSENKVERIKAAVLKFLECEKIDVTDVLVCNAHNKNKILNIKNLGYIIEDDTDVILDINRKFYSKARICCITKENDDKVCQSNKNIFITNSDIGICNDVLDYKRSIEQHLQNPITPKSGIPSIDKIWTSSYSAAQYFAELPQMPIWEYIYLNNYSNMDSLALRYFGSTMTFKELFEQVEAYAKSLKVSGVKEDDIVTICMPNTPEAVVAFFAVNKIGAVASMLHPLLKGEDILNTLNMTKSKYMVMADMCYGEVSKIIDCTSLEHIVVVSPSDSMPPIKSHPLGIKMLYIAQNKLKRLKTHISICKLNVALKMIPKNCMCVLSQIKTEIERLKRKNMKVSYGPKFIKWADEINLGKQYTGSINLDNEYVPYKTSVLLRTGGTTGKAKIAGLSNENIISNTSQLRDTIPFYKKGDELLAISPIFHGFGLVDSIITALAVNMSVDLHPQYNKSIFISAMIKNKPTLILGVPTLWKSVISDKRLNNQDLSFSKVWISGGDTLQPKLRKEINDFRFNHNAPGPIQSGIGSTEATAALAYTGLNSKYEKSVGFPLPLNNVKILNPKTLEEVKLGETGVLFLNGPTVMNEYYGNESETKKALIKLNDGKIYLNTGDVCFMTENGEICFEDRDTNIIIVSGVNVYGSEIEPLIKEVPEVSDCAVVKMPHDYKMNVPVAFITLRNNIMLTEELKEKIMRHVNSKVDTYQRIYDVILSPENKLPLTNLNKINRKQLQYLAQQIYEKKYKKEYIETEDSVQKVLKK